ncbi:MAG: hypothetical protein IMW98_04675 [Firmicutes bacterium]|nr:hypothetical protein [Bacillota bacterium]
MRIGQRRARAAAAALLAAALFVTGCGAGARPKPGATGPAKGASEIGADAARNAGQMPWAPKELIDMEGQAESLVDAALAGDWTRADASAARLKADWPTVRREVARRGVSAALLSRVDRLVADALTATSRRDAQEAAGKANAVTGYGAAFMNLFQMTLPPQIPMMDFQARAAMLDAQAGEWRTVEAEVGALDGVWLSFHPTVRARRPDNRTAIEQRLAALAGDAQAKDAAAVRRDAEALIREVDRLRTQFLQGK